MTILDQLIEETQAIENQVKQAVATRRISGNSGKVLTEECLRSAVAMRHGDLVRARMEQEQTKTPAKLLSVPPPTQ